MDWGFWGLCRDPFGPRPASSRLFRSPTHDEALARLHYLAESRRPGGLLMGPAGSGKSLVFEQFLCEVERRAMVTAVSSLLGGCGDELLWSLAAQWGANPDRGETTGSMWRTVVGQLAEHRYQAKQTVIILDDIEVASAEVIDLVVRLAAHGSASDAGSTLLLSGRGECLSRLPRRLLDRLDLRIDLMPWNVREVDEFLADSLSAAGRDEPAFTPSAVERLTDLSDGIPRHITRLAGLALVAAAGQRATMVEADTVQAAHDELSPLGQVAKAA